MFGVAHGNGRPSWGFVGGIRTMHMPFDFVDCYSGDTPIDIARNIIATRCLQTNCDYLLFVDSDIILRPDTLDKLLVDDFPIVSATYRQRVEPYNLAARIGDQFLKPDDVQKIQEANRNTILARTGERLSFKTVEVEQVGMGCILIHRLVFLRLAQLANEWRCLLHHGKDLGREVVRYTDAEARKRNWTCKYCNNILLCDFFHYRTQHGGDTDSYSEDYVFCDRARKAGFHIFIQIDNVVTHETAPWRIDETGLTDPSVDAAVKTWV
jgi:hypothetical protein